MHIISYAPLGYRGELVSVEVDIRTGIPGTDLVGLPASEVREARDRIRVAVKNSRFVYPACRILVNLAPADVPKAGNGFDLAMALAILIASGQMEATTPEPVMVLGELHLDGAVGPVRGVISAVDEAAQAGIRRFVVPAENRAEAEAVGVGRVVPVRHLSHTRVLTRELNSAAERQTAPAPWGSGHSTFAAVDYRSDGDFLSLRGSAIFKRALTIAAAGGHHLIVVGPPGTGKSMGVGLLPSILPPLTRGEALEVTRIHSVAGELDLARGLAVRRPFRAPHHNSSTEGLLGGGRTVRPGEVSLAHRGVLFLDEALEFHRPVLQGLREPLERKRVQISRAGRRYWFPAAFQLIMAANPCPCGNLGRAGRVCLCSMSEVDRYWRRVGGPLLDRVDLRVVSRSRDVGNLPVTEGSGDMRRSVDRAVVRQRSRRPKNGCNRNADLPVEALLDTSGLSAAAARAYRVACEKLRLSTRASVSVVRVARTIADLEDSDRVLEDHLLEAVAHRRNGEDRPLWDVG